MKEVAIIGAGPAGIAAAIQLKRYGIDSLLFEKDDVGGLLSQANLVENYPGFPGGIRGVDLVSLFKRQLGDYGISVFKENVNHLSYVKDEFVIETSSDKYKSKIVVIASGTIPVRLKGLKEDTAKKVFYNIKNLLALSRHKIAIIGAGDIAFDYALNLSDKNDVIILNRKDKIKCLPLLFKKATANENISYRENTKVEKIITFEAGLRLKLEKKEDMDVDYVLIAIGKEPNLDFLSQHVKENVGELCNAKKLFMIGDVVNGIYRQAGISVGNGIKAAMEIAQIVKGDHLCGY